jgi:DNA-binding transcriptional regulator PaaX
MGITEKSAAKRNRKRKIRQFILSSIIAAGLVPVAVAAPNLIGALDKLGIIRMKDYRNQRINRSLASLLRDGLIEFRTKDNRKYIAITEKGKKVLSRWEMVNFKLKKPKKWDERWRIIIFDIQEKKRAARDQLRITLNQIGFYKLQRSVWVYPYDCEDLLMLLKADFQLGKNLLYIVAEAVENDISLRRHFGFLNL